MPYMHRRLAPSHRTLAIALFFMGSAGSAIAADTVVDIPAGSSQFFVSASPAAGDTYTLNNSGAVGINFAGIAWLSGAGAGTTTINNDGMLWGPVNFSGATGPVTLNVTSGAGVADKGWRGQGNTSVSFGSGADRVVVGEDGVVSFSGSTTIAFAGGDDALVNAGHIEVGSLAFTGLETFENSGAVMLTGLAGGLNAQGVDFVGSGASSIALRVALNEVTQACTGPAVTNCLSFAGGSTAGSTLIAVEDLDLYDSPALNTGITLVAGSSAAGDFSLDPASEHYVSQTSAGPVLQKGLIAYRLVYDDAGDRHMLVGVLADEAVQAATYTAAAQETWRATTGSWLTRQADLRAAPGGLESSAGLWARGGFSSSERDVAISSTQLGASYDYDAGYKQRVAHLVFGADLVTAAGQDSAFVLGGMIGIARSDVEYEASPTEAVYTGVAAGLYGSYLAGPLFVDAIASGSWMGLNAEVANMGVGEGVNITGDAKSLGLQVEAGWRADLGEGLYVEPLVAAAYVKTQFDDLDVPGGSGTIGFEDSSTSSRLGAGLRGGMDTQLMGMAASMSLTGRYWNESGGEGAAAILIANGATTTTVTDDFSGAFSEIAASLQLFSGGGGVSGFASAGGKFADGYQAAEISAGVRMAW